MLRSLEITADLVDLDCQRTAHALGWRGKVELGLDCFICERSGRTTVLEWGAERARCMADEEQGGHFTAARISAFDRTTEAGRIALRASVDFWWAPFRDARHGIAAAGLPLLTGHPWARLYLGYVCPVPSEPGVTSVQSDLVRPATLTCTYCGAGMAISQEAPRIRLVV